VVGFDDLLELEEKVRVGGVLSCGLFPLYSIQSLEKDLGVCLTGAISSNPETKVEKRRYKNIKRIHHVLT
jgi:hypothetical protein